MKLCITAVGSSLEAQTDASFGRAPWLVLVDSEQGTLIEAVENSGVNASQGAGIAAAQTMADNNVSAVLTGRLGPKAQVALSAAGIKMYEGLGQATVGQALEQFRQGQYIESGSQAGGTPAGNAPGPGPGRGMGGGRRGGGGGGGRGGGACRGNGSGQGRGNRQ